MLKAYGELRQLAPLLESLVAALGKPEVPRISPHSSFWTPASKRPSTRYPFIFCQEASSPKFQTQEPQHYGLYLSTASQ